MGQEIPRTEFTADDFAYFTARLAAETALLGEQLRAGAFCNHPTLVAGCEIEGWLLDRHYLPVADNAAFIARLGNPLVVPELARFNLELNCTPRVLTGTALRDLRAELEATWRECQAAAHLAGELVMLIGILPTLRERDLGLANLSAMNRYRALNEQVMKARGGTPIRIDIRGRDHLRLDHGDVMLEAGTTSLQLHLQVPASQVVRYYNAAQLLAAPMVAIAANSPLLFGRDLWAETRIRLFEQAVATGDGSECRVGFGHAWLEETPLALFADNLARYAPLLPLALDEPADRYAHLKLHNGTIWRWNRLLIGTDGKPGLRLEHRVMAAGPTFIDMLANAALFYGAIHMLATRAQPPERELSFAAARRNFYAGAEHGLDAAVDWLDGGRLAIGVLVSDCLVPLAREGLERLGVARSDASPLLEIITQRAKSGHNGAWWQRAWLAAHATDPDRLRALTARYVEHQRQGNPVHEWEL